MLWSRNEIAFEYLWYVPCLGFFDRANEGWKLLRPLTATREVRLDQPHLPTSAHSDDQISYRCLPADTLLATLRGCARKGWCVYEIKKGSGKAEQLLPRNTRCELRCRYWLDFNNTSASFKLRARFD